MTEPPVNWRSIHMSTAVHKIKFPRTGAVWQLPPAKSDGLFDQHEPRGHNLRFSRHTYP